MPQALNFVAKFASVNIFGVAVTIAEAIKVDQSLVTNFDFDLNAELFAAFAHSIICFGITFSSMAPPFRSYCVQLVIGDRTLNSQVLYQFLLYLSSIANERLTSKSAYY